MYNTFRGVRENRTSDSILGTTIGEESLSIASALKKWNTTAEEVKSEVLKEGEENSWVRTVVVFNQSQGHILGNKQDVEEFKKFVSQSTTQPSTSVKPTQGSINIYAGTGENAELSNFAIRPFEIKDYKFNSVEQAFQEAKYEFTKRTAEDEQIRTNIQNAKTSAEQKKLGSKYPTLNVKNWDSKSSEIMKRIIKLSFEQNPQALQKLLATENAELTHIQDKGKWGKEFPKLLMEVRDELKTTQPSTEVISKEASLVSKAKGMLNTLFATKEKIITFAITESELAIINENVKKAGLPGSYTIEKFNSLTKEQQEIVKKCYGR
jgi:ribA/ribD-fused uncharacterized protein